MGTHSHHDGGFDPNARIEMRDADLGLVAKTMAGILFGLVACMAIGVLQFRWEMSNQPAEEPTIFKTEGRLPSNVPKLQAFPSRDLAEFQQMQQQRLTGYAWADKQGEVASVPIDKAMDMVLTSGALAARVPGQPIKVADPKPQGGGAAKAAAAGPAAAVKEAKKQ